MGEKMTLEPCPFCGHAELFDQWPCEWLDGSGANVVRCPMCHGAAPAKHWNNRHLTQPAQAVDVGALSWLPAELRILAFGDELEDMTTGEAYHSGWNECLDAIKRHRTRALPNANGKEG